MTVVVGTAGHIDHGKTTLLRALTGIDADRLPEERRRGMTIDVGYAHMAFADGTELDFIDVPGHDRLVGNMLVGAGEIDAALLVVAADDGPRAQTREHLALLDALSIRHGVAVVTKADVAGAERTAAIVAEVEALLDGTTLRGSGVIPVSAVTGHGLDMLREALELLRDRVEADRGRLPGRPGPRLSIDRVFTVKGRGVVVTGTLRGGRLAAGDRLRLVPGDRSVRVREVQVHSVQVGHAGPGRAALNLARSDAIGLHRGHVLADDPAVVASERLLVALAGPLPDRARARLHLGTSAVDASVGRSGHDAIDLSDGRAAAILRLSEPVAVAIGDPLVLRRGSSEERIVGGIVLDPRPARGISRRRQTAERVDRLALAVTSADAGSIARARLDLHGLLESGAGPSIAPDVAGSVADAVVEAVAEPVALADARTLAARMLRRIVTADRSAAAAAGESMVRELIAGGRFVRDGAMLRPAGAASAPPVSSDPVLAAAMDRLERSLDEASPPGLEAAARAAGCSDTGIRELERTGRIVILEPDLAYAARAYRSLVETAVTMATQAPLTPAALRDATGTSRRYVLAILTDLDRRAILRRAPDGHVPGPRSGAPTIAPGGR